MSFSLMAEIPAWENDWGPCGQVTGGGGHLEETGG